MRMSISAGSHARLSFRNGVEKMSFKFKKILLAISDVSAKKAIERAALIARKSGAHLELFSVVRPATAFLGGNKAAVLRVTRANVEARLAKLDALAGRLRADGLTVICNVDTDYSPGEAIIRRLKLAKADLVVIEAHKHGLLARLMLTQTDFDLVRHCPTPLLIVKNARTERRPVVVAALDPWHASGKPAGLDARIAELTHAISRAVGGKPHAAHVYAPLLRYESDSVAAPIVVPVPAVEQKRYTTAIRRRFKAEAHKLEISPQNAHLRMGDPAIVLPELAASLKADTIVMGAISRSIVSRVFIGSTTERVLDAMPCNVLIVKSKGFRP
jgi:universal stress protein E